MRVAYELLTENKRSIPPNGFRHLLATICLLACFTVAPASAQDLLPDAPQPAIELAAGSGANSGEGQTFPPSASDTSLAGRSSHRKLPSAQPVCQPIQSTTTTTSPQMSCAPTYDPFQKFLNTSEAHPLTPKQKAMLAGKNVIDPFNLLTIGGLSAISVAADSHSAYGPGMPGWAKMSGVSLTQDMTDEFFSTFLISSLMHQDPHYHRMPNASIPRRVAHCIYQVVWTQGDDGRGMFNYANVAGGVIEEGIADAYVPYRNTGWSAAASRYGIALATDPIGNFITEFVPDLARHVNIHVVFVQRIINRVAVQQNP